MGLINADTVNIYRLSDPTISGAFYMNYARHILDIRNGDKIFFTDQKFIDINDHLDFMAKHKDNYYVATWAAMFIGFVGHVNFDIRVGVHRDFRGKGVGKRLIEHIMQEEPRCTAKVKAENEASLALFRSCGFEDKYILLEKPNEA